VAGRPAAARATRSLADDVGPKLRARREAERLSLRELARRLQISPSALSQIETGKSRPSVSTLYALVTELGISLDSLFGRDGGSARSAPTRVQRRTERRALELESGVRWERLTAPPDGDTDFLWVVYEPGGTSCDGDGFNRHRGREYAVVLSGTLEVTVGLETYALGAGDSISFDSATPHRLANRGAEPAQAVWVVSDHGAAQSP
jgi:transcriptional regulator with XRE-family HTH domain